MQIVYVGHDLDGVEIQDLDVIAKPGEPVEVPDELAGRVPSGHRADVDDEGNSTFDPGSGLLAQPTNWQPYVAPPADPLEAMKVADLRAHADGNGIDLGDAKTKPDILAAIRGAADNANTGESA
jgi:hypothetical protein